MRRARVLIVESENNVAQGVRSLLLDMGHSVTSVVSSGVRAVKAVENDPPDLVLMDIVLKRGRDGIAAARRIRARFDIPIVYLTAGCDEEILRAAYETEPGGFVLKPVEADALKIAVEMALYKQAREQTVRDRQESLGLDQRRQIEEELNQSKEVLRKLSLHLQSAREDESKRIAREIHDVLGQALTAFKMDLAWLSHRMVDRREGQKKILGKLKSMSELIDMTIQTVQRISADLRPGVLDDLGLVPAVEWLTQEFEKRSGVRCSVNLKCRDAGFSPDFSTAVFRIIQEALTNVGRHAEATQVRIDLKENGRDMELTIWDNGKGIGEEEIKSPESLGLIGIRERLLPFGGGLRMEGVANKGTTLSIKIPLKYQESV